MTAMLQVAFMAVGLAVLSFVIAFLFKKWQRIILWAVALMLFVGTSVLIGFGLLKIYEDGMVNHAVLLGIVQSTDESPLTASDRAVCLAKK